MATNLAIDPELLNQALAIGGVGTKKETVTIALKEFIARRARATIVDHFNTIEWDAGYDYKAERTHRDGKLGLIDSTN